MKTNYKLKFYFVVLLFVTGTFLKAQWSNGQNATYVIGQTNFTNTTSGTSDSTFSSVVTQGCTAIDSRHNVMYVIDFFNSRVLRFSYPLTANSPHANLVFGQPAFNIGTANNGGLSASSLHYPGSCTVDTVSGTLWVADNGNQRILRFDSAFAITTNMPAADEVLGQPTFTSAAGPGCSSTQINIDNGPITGNLVHYDQANDILWFVDNGNNRVLRFNSPKTIGDGAAANNVLGQATFSGSGSGTSQNQFSRPDGATTIGNSLFISDAQNNRILRFDNVTTLADGANASGVIGQTDFISFSAGISQNQVDLPSGLCSDCSGSLYVADLNNNRVLIFYNATALANGGNASAVLLKSIFTDNATNGPSQSNGGTCSTVAFDNRYGNLVVLDRTNSRYLVFNTCLSGSFNSQPQSTSVCSGEVA
ncbi:MAG TPA: NHL repeat-containing protein, partial [Bacteroidia bacterium]|nr:NHL repeat-containing protein [Bacteroidia bacterium]